MKKIFNILLLAVFTLSVFTACEKDDDSNPVLKEPTTFSLNLPPYAANNIYDLKNAKTVELTCSQPDYGFPAATTYSVQVALNSEFTEKTEESEANYTELTTTYSTAKMDVVASELNTAIIELWTAQNEGADFPTTPISVFIRLKATITDSDRGVCISNVIELPKVLGNAGNRVWCLFRGIQQSENAPCGSGRCAETARHPRNAGEGLGELLGILEHGLHVADPHLTTQYGQTSQQGADSVAKVIYQVGDWSDLTRCNLGTLSGTLEFPIDSIKLLFCSIRVVEHRHQLLPLVHLLDVAVELSQEFLP